MIGLLLISRMINQFKLISSQYLVLQDLQEQLARGDADKGDDSSDAGESRASLLEALSNYTATNAR